jgi:hypothetical protein
MSTLTGGKSITKGIALLKISTGDKRVIELSKRAGVIE